MAHNKAFAARVRKKLKRRKGFGERKMFGGVAFSIGGNMCCGVINDDLMVRLGEPGATAALGEPHTRPMDFTGSPLKTMLYVGPAGTKTDADLKAWLDRAVTFARTLPPK